MLPDTVVDVWKGGIHSLARTTLKGFRSIYSACWYLSRISMGQDWKKAYGCDPQAFNGKC